MIDDSREVTPWALNSVSGIICQLLHSLLSPFILQMLRGDIKSGKYVNPSGADLSTLNSEKELHSVTSFINAQSRRKCETSKDWESANVFWVKTILDTFCYCVKHLSERAKLSKSSSDTSEHFVTDWAQTWIFQTWYGCLISLNNLFCCYLSKLCHVLISSEQ